jgi:DnaJ like chaperone protein
MGEGNQHGEQVMGANKGVLRGIGAALGEFFHGGKLEPDQEVRVEVWFGLLGYLAGADSIVTSHEAEFANDLMKDMDLPARGRDIAQQAFLAGRQRKIDIDAEITRFLELHSASSAEAGKLYDALLQLAAADGRIRPNERIFLERVTKRLGFSLETLKTRLGEG